MSNYQQKYRMMVLIHLIIVTIFRSISISDISPYFHPKYFHPKYFHLFPILYAPIGDDNAQHNGQEFINKSDMDKQIVIHEFVIPHERHVKSNCEICSEEFGLTRREHVCKRCMRSVCDDCSPFKIKSYAADFKNRARRMCRSCHTQSQSLQKYVKGNHLKMGEDSDLVRMWLKQLGMKSAPKKRTSQRRKPKSVCTFRDVWKSLNFSFRELIGKVLDQSQISQDEVTQLINMAMSELSGNKLIDYQHSIYILLFFLAHSNISNAVYFTNIIIQLVYSEETSVDNIAYFMEQMQCTEIQIYKMENIIEETFQRMVRRCTINVFTADMTIEIMSHLIARRDFQELEKGIAYVFCQRRQFICQNANKPEQIYLDILRNLSSTGYRQYTKEIDSAVEGSSKSSRSRSRNGSENGSMVSEKSAKSSPTKLTQLQAQNKKLKAKVQEQQQQIFDLHQKIQKLTQGHIQSPKMKNGKKNSKNSESQNDDSILLSYRQASDEKLDPYSTEDEATFNEIVQKKNGQIVSLKKQIQSLKEIIAEAEDENRIKQYQKQEQLASSLASSQLGQKGHTSKEDQIAEIRKQNDSLRNMNKKLLLKMQQLSTLLMDKQEKKLAQANGQLESLVNKLDNGETDFKKQECRLF